MTGSLTCSFTSLQRKRFKQRISYYLKFCTGFNVMERCISLSGDIHPLPRPENSGKILVHTGNRQNWRIPKAHSHVSANCTGCPKGTGCSSNFMRYYFWSKLYFYMNFLKYVSYSIEYLRSEVQLSASSLCFFITFCSRCGIKWHKPCSM